MIPVMQKYSFCCLVTDAAGNSVVSRIVTFTPE